MSLVEVGRVILYARQFMYSLGLTVTPSYTLIPCRVGIGDQ
jgi:hypothetical protein